MSTARLLLRHRLFAVPFRHSHQSSTGTGRSLRVWSSKADGGETPATTTAVASDSSIPARSSHGATDGAGSGNTTPDDFGPELLLYIRNTNPSVALLRSGFFCSTFHTAYWIWYVTDFMPLVNASPMEQLHIHTLWGYVGITMAVAINVIFIVYPKRFISKLVYRPTMNELVVFTYRLPWMHPGTYASGRFPVGDQATTTSKIPERKSTDYFRLDTTSGPGKKIVAAGDLTSFRGHLIVGSQWPRYSMDMESKEDLVEPEMLLEILVRPEYFRWDDHPGDDNNPDRLDDYSAGSFRRNNSKRKVSVARSWRRRR
jgi:hypothetical protein